MTNKFNAADITLIVQLGLCIAFCLIALTIIGVGLALSSDLMSGLGLLAIVAAIIGLASSLVAAAFIIEHIGAQPHDR